MAGTCIPGNLTQLFSTPSTCMSQLAVACTLSETTWQRLHEYRWEWLLSFAHHDKTLDMGQVVWHMMINGYTDKQHTCHQHTHSVTVCLGSLRFATACCLHSSFNLAHTPFYTRDRLRSGDTHCTLAYMAHLLLMHIYCMSQFNQWCELLLPCCPQVQYKIAHGIANGVGNQKLC